MYLFLDDVSRLLLTVICTRYMTLFINMTMCAAKTDRHRATACAKVFKTHRFAMASWHTPRAWSSLPRPAVGGLHRTRY